MHDAFVDHGAEGRAEGVGVLVQQFGHVLDAEFELEFLSEGDEQFTGAAGIGEGLGHRTGERVGHATGTVGGLHVVEGFHAEGGGKHEIAGFAGFAHEAGHGHGESGLLDGRPDAGIGGQGVERIGGVHEQERGSLDLVCGHGLGVVHEALVQGFAVVGGVGGDGYGEGQIEQTALSVHAAEQHVDGHGRHDGACAAAAAERGAGDDERTFRFDQSLGRGFKASDGHAGDAGNLFGGVGRGEGGKVAETGGEAGFARLDDEVGDAEQQGHIGAGLHGQPEIGACGGVVLHGAGVDELLGGLARHGMRAVEQAAVGGHDAPAFEHGSAHGKDAVAAFHVVAQAALTAHGFPCGGGGKFLVGHEVEVGRTALIQNGGEHFVDARRGIAGHGGHGRAGFLHFFFKDGFGLFPGDGHIGAVGGAAQRSFKTRGTHAKFGFGGGERGHGPVGHGVVLVADGAHGHAGHGAHKESGAGRAQFAHSGQIFAFALLEARNPAPVLGPVHGVVKSVPDDGRRHEAHGPAGGKFKKSSSIHDFLAFALLVAGEAGIAGVGVAHRHMFGMATFAPPHQHGVFGVSRKPVFPIDGRHVRFGHVEVASGAERGRFLGALEFGKRAEVQSVTEEHVVGLLLINQPFRLDLAARLNVVADKAFFFRVGAQNREMAFRALSGGGRSAERSVGAHEVALLTGHALLLYVFDVAEGDGLLFGFLHKVGQNPPSQNKGHYQPHDKRAPATAAFLCRSRRCGCVVPLLHPDASCWLR